MSLSSSSANSPRIADDASRQKKRRGHLSTFYGGTGIPWMNMKQKPRPSGRVFASSFIQFETCQFSVERYLRLRKNCRVSWPARPVHRRCRRVSMLCSLELPFVRFTSRPSRSPDSARSPQKPLEHQVAGKQFPTSRNALPYRAGKYNTIFCIGIFDF